MTDQDPGQGGAPFPFTPQDALAFLSKLWNPLGVAMPGFPAGATGAPGLGFPAPSAMFAALDPREVDRKLAELRIVENWLAMSLDMMRMSIKTLELQKASLEALAAARRPLDEAARPASATRRKRRKDAP